MSIQAILAPVFVLVALTFGLLAWTGYLRVGGAIRREVRLGDIALGQPNWPPRTIQAGNAFNNQLQLPVLFYVLAILALFLHKADLIFVVLSWLFVLSRIVHAGIHISGNNVNRRFAAYAVGFAVLLLMWIIFALQILLNI
ncbi:MAG: MAPEG family protein [Xanthobacteraceae bacterium]